MSTRSLSAVHRSPTKPSPPESSPTPETLAALCKASADPLRLAVLRVLARDSFGVLELCRILDCSQPGLSHHLKILAKAGLVTARREGNSLFYRRLDAGDPALAALQRALLQTVDQLPLEQAVAARMTALQGERAQRSRQFFTEHAGDFRAQQELVAAFELYGPQAAEMVERAFPAGSGSALAIEVGPGDGAFLPLLAARFERVIALDNAPEMLAQSRELVRARGLANVDCIAGDTRAPQLAGIAADCVVLNMVLHHVPSPAELFADLTLLLRRGGVLIISELCRHDQPWVQQACGDLWLGFEPEELGQWAAAAGFRESGSSYLAQRNGFRVQVRQFERT
jgi:ArsR family transcriptional regulator